MLPFFESQSWWVTSKAGDWNFNAFLHVKPTSFRFGSSSRGIVEDPYAGDLVTCKMHAWTGGDRFFGFGPEASQEHQ